MKLGILQQFTVSYEPQQNGTAELLNVASKMYGCNMCL